jgi:hypothetical protein
LNADLDNPSAEFGAESVLDDLACCGGIDRVAGGACTPFPGVRDDDSVNEASDDAGNGGGTTDGDEDTPGNALVAAAR